MARQKTVYTPVIVVGRTIAKSWWGQAWCNNLESYADYENRIGRGKTYVRAGNVLHLQIEGGKVTAKVQGSRARPYDVTIVIKPINEEKWKKIVSVCGNKIGSLGELAAGSFPQEFAQLFTQREQGLFPSPREIAFGCSCPDSAYMCKHVAAVLYGIGTRLDGDPTLFFTLRGIDVGELIKKSVDEKAKAMLASAGKKTPRTLQTADLRALFGDDIDAR